MDLTTPHVMGILNVTPDSFSDGGRYSTAEQAFETGIKMLQDGATILDIGGESTRPGASPVSVQQELDRVMPVLEKLRAETYAVLSVDTSKPEVMREAVSAGAGLINDVYALRRDGALETAAAMPIRRPAALIFSNSAAKTKRRNAAVSMLIISNFRIMITELQRLYAKFHKLYAHS